MMCAQCKFAWQWTALKFIRIIHPRNSTGRYRERLCEGYACIECNKTEGIKQRAGRCHRGNEDAPVARQGH
eukprot:347464-Chlamydomonas_euryale.AAC.9